MFLPAIRHAILIGANRWRVLFDVPAGHPARWNNPHAKYVAHRDEAYAGHRQPVARLVDDGAVAIADGSADY